MKYRFLVFVAALLLSMSAQADHKRHHKHHSKGFRRHEKWRKMKEAFEHRSFSLDESPIPGRYSLSDCSTQVEDQGSCGSCWDFALTGGLRDSLACTQADPGRLSFNYLLDCATEQYGCSGGDFDAANHLISPNGPGSYDLWPYTQSGGKCRSLPALASAEQYQMLGSNGNPSFKDISHVVGVLHQPVVVDIAADMAWENYSSGIYASCGSTMIDHMVVVSGYDCESSVDSSGNCVFDQSGNLPPGVGTYTIKNSWGKDWGESGYIRMKATDKRGKRCNAVATDALYYQLPPKPQPSPIPNPTNVNSGASWGAIGLGAFFAAVIGASVWALAKRPSGRG